MSNLKFKEISESSFEDLLREAEIVDFQQTLEMKQLFDNMGRKTFIPALVDENDKAEIAGLIFSEPLFGGIRMEMTLGPVFKSFDEGVFKQYLTELKNFVKGQNALEFYITPNIDLKHYDDEGNKLEDIDNTNISSLISSLGFNESPFDNIYEWMYVKELNDYDSKKLLKSFTKDGQYSIKKTQQFGVKVRKMAFDELSKFKEVTEHTAERRGYTDKSLEYYQNIFNSFGDKAEFLAAEINLQEYKDNLLERKASLENQLKDIEEFLVKTPNSRKKNNQKKEVSSEIEMYVKRLKEADELIDELGTDEILLSVALIIYNDTVTTYLFSGTYEKYKRFYAPFAIQDYALNKSISNNVPLYNFYGISGDFDGTDGVLGFKTNFSGYAVEKVGAYVVYPKPMKKKVINLLKKAMGRK